MARPARAKVVENCMQLSTVGLSFVAIVMVGAAVAAALEFVRVEVQIMSSPYTWLTLSGFSFVIMVVVCLFMHQSMPHLTAAAARKSQTGAQRDATVAADAATEAARPMYDAMQHATCSVAFIFLLVGLFLARYDGDDLGAFNDRYDIDIMNPATSLETFVVGEWYLWNLIMVFVMACSFSFIYAATRAFYGTNIHAVRKLAMMR